MSIFASMSGKKVSIFGSQVADSDGKWIRIADTEMFVEYVELLYSNSPQEPYILFLGMEKKSHDLLVGIAPAWDSDQAYLSKISPAIQGDGTGFQKQKFKTCFAEVIGELHLGDTTSIIAKRKAGDTRHVFMPMYMPSLYKDLVFGIDIERKMPLVLESTESGARLFIPIGEEHYVKK